MSDLQASNKPNSFDTQTLLTQAQTLVHKDLESVNELLTDSLESSQSLIKDVSGHIIDSGGKRMRPLVTLLAAHALGYQGSEHHKAAVIGEFIHTATLLHDDVVDDSALRRGRETANQRWGNEISVLVGDFVYSRTFQLITSMNNPLIMEILAKSTGQMAEGELKQLANRGDPEITVGDYLDIIHYKTAKLFEIAADMAAIVSQCDDRHRQALQSYGLNFGMAFQLIDDALDYNGDDYETGKKVGDDLAEGKATLPVIYAMRYGSNEHVCEVRQALEQCDRSRLDRVVEAVHHTGAGQQVVKLACDYAAKAKSALQVLPDSIYKQGLHQVADFAVGRWS